MKNLVKFLSVGVLMVVALSANAQNFNKGDWFLNANVSDLNLTYSHRPIDSLSVIHFNIGASAGYMISNKFAVDAEFGLDYSKVEDNVGRSSFVFGAGVRYYPVGNLFARIAYQGAVRKNEDLYSVLGVAVGYDWFFSEKMFFEPAVVYTKSLAKDKTYSLGLSLGIGIKF